MNSVSPTAMQLEPHSPFDESTAGTRAFSGVSKSIAPMLVPESIRPSSHSWSFDLAPVDAGPSDDAVAQIAAKSVSPLQMQSAISSVAVTTAVLIAAGMPTPPTTFASVAARLSTSGE